jgi:phosphocarrier protein HPr
MADNSGIDGTSAMTVELPPERPSDPALVADASQTTCAALVTIRNRKGLHARASAKFVKCAELYEADVVVVREGQSVGGTSIMGLMMLAAGPGSVLSIRAQGADAGAALSALIALVEDGFGEDCVDD